MNIIKENCNFDFYFNKNDAKSSVLDGGHEIILANWPSFKRIMCSFSNNIPINILSHPYVLVNRSILCNCNTEAESNCLLESLAACDTSAMDLVMYFTNNLAFVNYLESLIDSLEVPILQNRTPGKRSYLFLYSHLNLIPIYYRHQNIKGVCMAVFTEERNFLFAK